MTRPAWSWKDYERCKRAEERKAARAAAKLAAAQTNSGEVLRPDSTRGPEGRVADGRDGLAPAANVSRRSPVQKVVPPKTRQACPSLKPAPAPAPILDDAGEGFDAARGGKIDISAAPSGMEAAAARWVGKVHAPGTIAEAVPVLCEGKVMCRCGAQGPGQTRGPVPVWFGDKCIEANCELRARRGLTEMEGANRG